jgi:hypothetical protein
VARSNAVTTPANLKKVAPSESTVTWNTPDSFTLGNANGKDVTFFRSGVGESASAKALIGIWTIDNPKMIDQTVEYKADGTITMTGTTKNPPGVTFQSSGIYRVSGNEMTEILRFMSLTAPANASDETKQRVAAANKVYTPASLRRQPPENHLITWKDPNTFTTDSGKDLTTYHRNQK